MTQDLCDILVRAYCTFNGQITHEQVRASQANAYPAARAQKFLSALRLLTKYHFLKAISPDRCILMPQGLVYVEENGLVSLETIRRDQKLRTGLLRAAAATLAGNSKAASAWNAGMLAEGYTQEEIDGRYHYLHTLNLL